MRLVEQTAQVLPQSYTLEGVFKQIELAGRTCYKSEDKITEDSAKKFVDMLIKRGHGSPLEHGTVYLKIPAKKALDSWTFYLNNPYSRVYNHGGFWYISTNYRVMIQNKRDKDYQYMYIPGVDEIPIDMRRFTVKITCSIGICREIIRHRTFSYCNESTRFCNYSKNRFNNEITFVLPDDYIVKCEECAKAGVDVPSYISHYKAELEDAEFGYFDVLMNKEVLPERARDILPLATKTELVMTGFISDWQDFFRQRISTYAHRDMMLLAMKIQNALNDEFNKEGFKFRFIRQY